MRSVRPIAILAAAWIGLAPPAAAQAPGADDPRWQAILEAARGQTVYFNGWGGAERINAYVDWAAGRVLEAYGVRVRHVRVGDIAEVVSRILAERVAGRTEDGSVDLMWINGENFAAMKRNDLLGPPFTGLLPNYAFVDTEGLPTTLVDFGEPVEGLEAPWGMAQLVFLYDRAYVEEPPRSMPALLDYVRRNPGRFAYPQPPDFHGTTFLKQALISLADDPAILQRPVDEVDFAAVAAPLWDYLEELHPHLWRGGQTFPQSGPQLIQMLDDGEIDIAFNFNPAEASAAILDGRLPDTVRTYVLDGGTIGNTHFTAIPFNAAAREGAMVFANFLLSPEAQLRKADPEHWGDPTVLDVDRLPGPWPQRFADLDRGPATLTPAERGTPQLEPHASWMPALEAEWLNRYGQ
jgi:putative thiamine transport system substrate-binding protein